MAPSGDCPSAEPRRAVSDELHPWQFAVWNTNVPLATGRRTLLEPGRLPKWALDLPPARKPEGEQIYTLHADEP